MYYRGIIRGYYGIDGRGRFRYNTIGFVYAPCIRVHGHCTTVCTSQYTAVYTVVYTAMYTGRNHGCVWAVYTHTRPYTGRVHVYTARAHGFVHTALYTVVSKSTRPVHGRFTGRVHVYTTLYTAIRTGHVHGGRVHDRVWTVYTAATRPCTRTVYVYTTAYTAV